MNDSRPGKDRISALFILIAGLAGITGVASGAISSHADLPGEELRRIGIASQYLLWHAPALLAAAILRRLFESRTIFLLAGAAFIGGMLLFSGNLILMAFAGFTAFSAMTPVGGMLYMLGWLALLLAGLRGTFSGHR